MLQGVIVAGQATRFTQAFVNSAGSEGKARARYWDATVPGLVLTVTSQGAKKYCAVYRDIEGRQREPRIGDARVVTLDQARKAALKLISEAQLEGRDPIAEKLASRKLATDRRLRTFSKLWDVYWAECQQRRSKNRNELERHYYRTQLAPRFGELPIADVNADAIAVALYEIASGSGPGAANTTLEVCRQMLSLALSRRWVAINMAGGIKPFPKNSRERVATEAEVGKIWHGLEVLRQTGRSGGSVTALALQFTMLTLQRRSEIAGLHWLEIDWGGRLWTIPGPRTKNKKGPHLVPLSDAALNVLVRAFDGRQAGFAFTGRGDESLDPHVMTRAFSRVMGAIGIEDLTVHDLRRTGATMLTSERVGVMGETISRILNHSPPGPAITLVYNRNNYLPQKRAALDAWADEVKRMADQPSAGPEMRLAE